MGIENMEKKTKSNFRQNPQSNVQRIAHDVLLSPSNILAHYCSGYFVCAWTEILTLLVKKKSNMSVQWKKKYNSGCKLLLVKKEKSVKLTIAKRTAKKDDKL